jgi:hypothetical protein
LRGTPHYHDQGKKHLFAMLRQLGSCTFFLTTSMADTRWPELLCSLSLLVDKKKLSKEEAVSLPYLERARVVHDWFVAIQLPALVITGIGWTV